MERKWYPDTPKSSTFLIAFFFGGFGVLWFVATIYAALGRIPFEINDKRVEDPSFMTMWPFMAISIPMIITGLAGFMSVFAGCEITDEKVTNVDWLRRRTELWWSEIESVAGDAGSLTLRGAGKKVTISKSYRWEILRPEFEKRLPARLLTAPDRLAVAPEYGTVYRPLSFGTLKFLILVAISVSTLAAGALVGGATNSMTFALVLALESVVMVLFFFGLWRRRVEVNSDGIVSTPMIGAPVQIAYSDIRSLRYRVVMDEGTAKESWVITTQDGRSINIPKLLEMDLFVAAVASRMPKSAEYVGAPVL